MSNFMIILDILVVTGLCVSAILACHLEKLLSAVIALSVTGLFAAAAFLLLTYRDRGHDLDAEMEQCRKTNE